MSRRCTRRVNNIRDRSDQSNGSESMTRFGTVAVNRSKKRTKCRCRWCRLNMRSRRSLVDHVALTDCQQAYGRLAGVSVQNSSATRISLHRATCSNVRMQDTSRKLIYSVIFCSSVWCRVSSNLWLAVQYNSLSLQTCSMLDHMAPWKSFSLSATYTVEVNVVDSMTSTWI